MNRFAVLALAAAIAAPAMAQQRVTTTTTTSSSNVKFALGFKAIQDGTGGIHGRIGIGDRMHAGLVFGHTGNFGSLLIGGDFQYDFVKMGDHAFYGEGGLGFAKAAGNNLYLNLLFGFRMALFSNIDMGLGYGFQAQFIDANAVAFTSNPLGNASIHWKF